MGFRKHRLRSLGDRHEYWETLLAHRYNAPGQRNVFYPDYGSGEVFAVLGASKANADGDGLVTKMILSPRLRPEAVATIRQGVGSLSKMHIAYTDIASNEAQLTQDVDTILDQSWNAAAESRSSRSPSA